MRSVAYYRVSTSKQAASGLGLEAQQAAVTAFLAGEAPVASFVETESGSKSDRPELAKALAACRVHKARLVVAKLDRLARNVAFVSALMEAGVPFIAVDFPQANNLTVHIMSAVAEHEREMIRARTVAALQAAKERGTVLGGWRGGPKPSNKQRAAASAVLSAAAQRRADELRDVVREIGAPGPAALARELNKRGITSARDRQWTTAKAARLLARLAPKAKPRRSGKVA